MATAPEARSGIHLVYMDDSQDQEIGVCTALMIPAEAWHPSFQLIRAWRRDLKEQRGVYVYKELHAWKLLAGKGRLGTKVVPKAGRHAIFNEGLSLVARLPGAQVINAVFDKGLDELAYERVLNRINRTMQAWGTYAILFWDQGKEAQHRRLTRQMRVFNPIPSAFGIWDSGNLTKNIPLDRIIEDPVFKDSQQSYFVQLTDFCAYALLRREHPLPARNKYGLHEAFSALDPVLFRGAAKKDPEGMVRIKGKTPR
jgi:hypothetical protein